MKKSTTAERLKTIMKERGLRQVDILEAAKPFCKKYNVPLGKAYLSQYISGKVEPGQDKLSILALALNVSEVWLMGYDVPIERKTTPVTERDERRQELLRLFDSLSDDQQRMAIGAIKGLLSSR